MNASATVRKSVLSASVVVALLAAGTAFSGEKLGRDSVYAASASPASHPTVAIQRHGRSSVYAGDVYTTPRSAAVKLTPQIAGNGRGSVYAQDVYTSPRSAQVKLTPQIAGNGRSSVFSWSNNGGS